MRDKVTTDLERETRAAAGPAEALRIEAADRILARRLSPDWNEDDQRELDAWLEDPAHRIAYLRLDAAWDRAGRLEAFRPLKRPVTAPAPQSRRPLIFKFAAAAVVVAAIVASSVYLSQPSMRTYATAVGERQTITLTDGSTIALNTNSVLKLSANANARMAVLERGEAFFQIRHDAQHPFIVTAAGHRITDLGTKFIVRQEGDRVEVKLLEGSARLDANDGAPSQTAVLTPGDVAIATANATSVTKRPVKELANDLGWRRGVLMFDHTTLAEAVAEFNRYSRQKIVIADPQIAKLEIGGTFPSDDVKLFGRATHIALGLHVEERGSTIVISQ